MVELITSGVASGLFWAVVGGCAGALWVKTRLSTASGQVAHRSIPVSTFDAMCGQLNAAENELVRHDRALRQQSEAIQDLTLRVQKLTGRIYRDLQKQLPDDGAQPVDPAALKNKLRAAAGLIPKQPNGKGSD